MQEKELKPLTNEECVEYFKQYLLQQKVKPHQIKVDGDLLTFEHKNTVYSLYIEGYQDIHYGVGEMYDVNIGNNFWINKDEYGDYEYIDEFFETIVKEKHYEYVRKIWKNFEKLEENDESDDLKQIICEYFGLYE